MFNIPKNGRLNSPRAFLEEEYDLEKLRDTQRRIASKILIEDLFEKPIKTVTGFDLAFFNNRAITAAVTLDYETFEVAEEKATVENVQFPYIPTFLSFREGPPIINLTKKLEKKPEILMINSQGIAHPLFCGCASHVGVLINKPTIGVAGSRLCGEYSSKPEEVGEWVPLNYKGRLVGAVLLTREGCNPIFVSPGHRITLKTAVEVVKHLVRGYKFPEPIRLAHNLANKVRREYCASQSTT